MNDIDPDPVAAIMDLARYHHDKAEFYRDEVEAVNGPADYLVVQMSRHRQEAGTLKHLARYLDGVADEPPHEMVAGYGMRSDSGPIPWREP